MHRVELDEIIAVLREARARILEELRGGRGAEVVGLGPTGDRTRRVDLAAERAVIAGLERLGVSGVLVSEECGELKIGEGGDLVFVLDPLDGTTNAVRGIPVFSISLAVAKGRRFSDVFMGVVMNVITGDVFYAIKGEGAYLNGKRVAPSSETRLENALLEVDLNARRAPPDYVERLAPLLRSVGHVRFLGSDALSLCHVAAGISELFVDLRGMLRVVDLAAGAFIALEAGARVLAGPEKPFAPELSIRTRSSVIASANDELLKEALRLLAGG